MTLNKIKKDSGSSSYSFESTSHQKKNIEIEQKNKSYTYDEFKDNFYILDRKYNHDYKCFNRPIGAIIPKFELFFSLIFL